MFDIGGLVVQNSTQFRNARTAGSKLGMKKEGA